MANKIVRNKRYIDKLTKALSYLEGENGTNTAVAFLLLIEKKEAALKNTH